MYCICKRIWWLLSKNYYLHCFQTVSKAQPNEFHYCLFLGSSEDKVKAIQEKLDLDDKLSSGERNKQKKDSGNLSL